MVSDGSVSSVVEKSFRIKQDDKFFSRLMSKETSMANSSSRVFYYGESSVAAVPFVWEEQPGTPKHPLSETSLLVPPLTPPPSYFTNNRRRIVRRNSSTSFSKSSSHNMFSCIFPTRFVEKSKNKRKTHMLTLSSSSLSSPTSSPSSSSSSSSSSSWSLVYPCNNSIKEQGSLSFSEYSRSNNNDDDDDGSFTKHKCSKGFIRGCYLFGRNID